MIRHCPLSGGNCTRPSQVSPSPAVLSDIMHAHNARILSEIESLYARIDAGEPSRPLYRQIRQLRSQLV